MAPTLRVDFLGDPARARAPVVWVDDGKGVGEPIDLTDLERLVLAYLALEAAHPDKKGRTAILSHVLGTSADDDLERVRKHLPRKLEAAGAGGAFRPYQRGAPDAQERDPFGKYSLRGVGCDLTELEALLRADKKREALDLLGRIRKRRGDAQPLPLVDPAGSRPLPAKRGWYETAARRFRDAQAALPAGEAAARQASGDGRVRRPSRPLIAAAVGGALALVVSAVFLLDGPGTASGCSTQTLTEPSPDDERAIAQPAPPGAGKPAALREIVTRSKARSVAVGSDGVWVAQSTDRSVWRIDPALQKTVGEPFPVGGTPFSVAVAKDVLWVTREDGVIVALDRGDGEIVKEISYGAGSAEVALGARSVWVNNYDGEFKGHITRIDPCSEELERIEVGKIANTVKFGYDAVWVSDSTEKALHRIDPATNEVTTIPLDVGDPQDLGAGDGYIWVAHYGPKRVTRVDPRSLERVGPPIEVGAGVAGFAIGLGGVWLPNYEGDSVTRIDLGTLGTEPNAVRVGDSPTDVALGFGRLWVPNNDDEPPSVTPIQP